MVRMTSAAPFVKALWLPDKVEPVVWIAMYFVTSAEVSGRR